MRFFNQGSMFSLALIISGCSFDGNDSKTNSIHITEVRPNPVIITMGGFNSCESDGGSATPRGNERWEKGDSLSRKFASGSQLWLRSCYDKRGNIHYITSENPRRIHTATIDSLDDFLDTVDRLSAGGANPVFVIGHSHGGWLALTTAYWLPSRVQVKLISTVDPISPRHCTSTNYIAAAASPIFSSFALAGCRRAPTDITDEIRGEILGRIPDRAWRHYYQRNFLPLSSAPFTGDNLPHHTQDLSPFLSNFPSGARPSMNAHSGIDQLSLIWYSFEVSIERSLSGT